MENKIEIFKTADNQTQIEVKFDEETVWLNQHQLAELFQRDRTAVARHISNVFKEGELEEKVVCANFAHTTQHGAIQGKTQKSKVKYYNLDVIISVGYRVNSKRGTQFRQWATQRLKDFLVKGAAINQKRLEELHKVVEIIQKTAITDDKQLSEAKGLLDILSQYTKSFVLLNQ